jgi:hypothetical protein
MSKREIISCRSNDKISTCFRIFVNNSEFSLFISKSPTMSVKSTTNRNLIRVFCDIVKNTIKNKTWKKKDYKILVEKFSF